MGGGGAKPAWVSVWKPGKPFPPTRTKYTGWQANIGSGLHEPLKAIVDEIGGTLFDVSEYRYSPKQSYRYRAMYGNNVFEIQIEPRVLQPIVKINRRIVGTYDLHDPESIQRMRTDIETRIQEIGEPPPIGEGCGVVRKIVPVSGGMDSALLALMHEDADRVYFDYGQLFKDVELLALESLGITPAIIDIGKQPIDEDGVFKSRNFKFFTALREGYPDEDLIVYFGNNQSDENPGLIMDNCQYSINAISEAIDLMYAGPSFKIESPLFTANYTKGNISDKLEEMISKDAFIIWCEGSDLMPCGDCHKCIQMKEYMLYDAWKERIRPPRGPISEIAGNITDI